MRRGPPGKSHLAIPLLVLAAGLALSACARQEEPWDSGTFENGPLDEAGQARLHFDTDLRPPSAQAWSVRVPEGVPTEEGLLRKIVAYSDTYTIDRIYKSMQGPKSRLVVPLGDPSAEPELLWIKGTYVEVVDEEGNPISPEFMCHVVGSVADPLRRGDAFGVSVVDARFATLSQGMFEKTYPEGFGLPVLSNQQLAFDSQVLNHNRENPHLRVRHKVVTQYIRDRDLVRPLKPIASAYAQVMVQVGGKEGEGYFGVRTPDAEVHGASCAVGRPADSLETLAKDGYGREFAPHWIVEPGSVVNETLTTQLMQLRYDTRIQTIDVHLHPFARWIELRDQTTGETLFRSEARQADQGIGLASVETYRSDEGIPVYADHEYVIASAYDNTSGQEQDAMASLYLGILDKEFDPSLLGDPAALAEKRAERDQAHLHQLEAALEADPEDALLHVRVGAALLALGRTEEANSHLRAAARLGPEDPYVEAQVQRYLAQLPPEPETGSN